MNANTINKIRFLATLEMTVLPNFRTGTNYDNIKAFLDKLESDGKEDWQIRQAYRSVKSFLEDFMCVTIDFSENPEDEFSDKPVKNPATWNSPLEKLQPA